MRGRLKLSIVTAIIAAVLMAAVFYARNYYIDLTNRNNLNEIVSNTLSRVERSLDRNLIEIASLHSASKIKCDSKSAQVLDDLVLRSSGVKDVFFRSNGVSCTSSSFLGALAQDTANGSDIVFARNKDVGFHAIKWGDIIGLVMDWKLNARTSVSTFLNLDSIVFDILPAAIRDTSNLEISLSDGTMLGALRKDASDMTYDIYLRADSERYPIYASLGVPQATLSAWISPLSPSAVLTGTLAIVMVSFLAARGLVSADAGYQAIRRALRNGSIFPYYQPIYCIATGELTGFEALARCRGRDNTMLSPATFIPTIEKNNWGDLLLEVLMKDAAKNMESVFEDAQNTTLAFNVTPKQLSREGFVPWFIELLTKTHMPPEAIILEVTEREVINDIDSLQRNISALRDYGITIAIDDVGTGHNGLSSIHQLRADYLKIDKLFVDGVVIDEHAAALVKMLIEVGAQYGMQIIAEGVETAEQLEALRKLGVDEVQGFYMAKPMPALEAIGELAHHRTVRTRVMLQKGLETKPADNASQFAEAS